MEIEQVLARRTDLSTFLVHLTRTVPERSAVDALKGILRDQRIAAKSPFGMAVNALEDAGVNTDSQKAVCFTETPLQHVSLLTEKITGRDCQFEPYGIAVARKQARRVGVNPVWYVDITPGHFWLTNPLNRLITEAIDTGSFPSQHIAELTPFVEQMGSYSGGLEEWERPYRKEFWWEREWRHVGDFQLPSRYMILCPSEEIGEFRKLVDDLDELDKPEQCPCIDPTWSLEMMLGKLAGMRRDDLGAF